MSSVHEKSAVEKPKSAKVSVNRKALERARFYLRECAVSGSFMDLIAEALGEEKEHAFLPRYGYPEGSSTAWDIIRTEVVRSETADVVFERLDRAGYMKSHEATAIPDEYIPVLRDALIHYRSDQVEMGVSVEDSDKADAFMKELG